MPTITESVTAISLWEQKETRMKRRHDLRVRIPRSTGKSTGEILRAWFDCDKSYHVVDITGVSQTDENGEMTWNLTDFVCINELLELASPFEIVDPIIFLATPMSSTPVYITTTKISVTESEPYVVLKIYSWDSNGQPAKGIMFSWYCRLQRREIGV